MVKKYYGYIVKTLVLENKLLKEKVQKLESERSVGGNSPTHSAERWSKFLEKGKKEKILMKRL